MQVRTSTPSLAFGALNQSDLEIPYSLLPPSRTSSHRQLQPRRREAATLLPAGSRRLWPHSLKPPTPSSMAAHYTRRGTHTWPPPLLTCQASLTCIRMLPPPLLLHWAQPAPLLISSPPRAPPGMLQPIPPTPALWCTRSPSVLGPASSLLPVWPLLSTNTSLPPSPTSGRPEAQQFTLDTHWVLPRSASIPTCSWRAWGRRGHGRLPQPWALHHGRRRAPPSDPLLKLLSQQSAVQGPTEAEGFSLGNLSQCWLHCCSLSKSALFFHSLFLWQHFWCSEEFRCPSSAVTRKRGRSEVALWKVFSLSDFISINALKNEWSPSLFNFVLL